MSVFRRPDRESAWWVDFRYSGRRVRKRSPVQTRRGTQDFEALLRHRMLDQERRGIDPFNQRTTTFDCFVERWFRDYVLPYNRPVSVKTKEGSIRKHLLPAFGALPLRAITPVRIDQFVASMRANGRSAKTVNNALSILRTILKTAVRWNLLESVPEIKTLEVADPGYKFLSVEECRKLVAAAPAGYWKTLIVFLLHTGCRFGEAAGIMWDDLELEQPAPRARIQRGVSLGFVGPTKNGRSREIPLTPAVVVELRTLPRTSEYVFVRPSGRFPSPSSTLRYLHRFCDDAGIQRISWHVLRHTFATELSTRRVPLRAIQDLLGQLPRFTAEVDDSQCRNASNNARQQILT